MKERETQAIEANNNTETSSELVGRFIDFTKLAMSDQEHALDVEWEHQMNMLYGDEDLARITKNPAYMGVPRVKEEFLMVYEHAGLDRLKALFFARVLEHTKVNEMGSAVFTGVEKILKFE